MLLPIEKFLLYFVAPTIVLLSLLEGVVLQWRRGHYDWRGMGVSYFDFVLRIVMTRLVPLTIAAPLVGWVHRNRLGDIALNDWGSMLLLFVGMEFFYYWLHRAGHQVRWFWANHAVHHSSNELNLAASLRIGAFGRLSGNVIFLLPLVWVGFDLRVVYTALTLNLLYQFWIHATWIPKLGWLEYVFNTPSAHRVHHASNLEYLDGNYGGVLIVFDRLFGTYIEERADVPCRYGWVQPITSHNPLKVEFAQWGYLVRDLGQLLIQGKPLVALATLFMPPGWAPNGASASTAQLRQRAGLRKVGSAVLAVGGVAGGAGAPISLAATEAGGSAGAGLGAGAVTAGAAKFKASAGA
jgi:sterol desaturase/sphingolipid hydroxylase (fatty acid hydroxylase superfamily)